MEKDEPPSDEESKGRSPTLVYILGALVRLVIYTLYLSRAK